MVNASLYVLTILIWGSGWIWIDVQTQEISAISAVMFRFSVAGVITLAALKLFRRGCYLPFQDHLRCAAMGMTMFAANYSLAYTAVSMGLTSGLAALIFSLLLLMNAFNDAVFFKKAPPPGFWLSAVTGITGLVLIFADDIIRPHLTSDPVELIPVLLCAGAVYLASLGNMISAGLQQNGRSVITTNAWSMLYGGVGLAAVNLVTGQAFTFPVTTAFIGSFAYLVVFTSIIAFFAYLTLVGRLGAARAGYAFVTFPLVALIISSVWEDFTWQYTHIAGAALILAGNLFFQRATLKTGRQPETPAS